MAPARHAFRDAGRLCHGEHCPDHPLGGAGDPAGRLHPDGRAKGLPEFWTIAKHTMRNAAIPIVTIVGLQLGNLLGGAVVTETIFSWPGIGRLAIQSIYNRDYPIVQSCVFVTAAMFVVLNFLVDITLWDPGPANPTAVSSTAVPAVRDGGKSRCSSGPRPPS